MWTGIIFAAIFLGFVIWAVGRLLKGISADYQEPTQAEIDAMNERLRRVGLDPRKAWKHGK